MFRKAIPALLAAGLAAGIASAASAAPVIFFGIDQNPGGTVPPAGNAATARASFLSNLTSVGNEDFESFAIGTGLHPITGPAAARESGRFEGTLI